MYSLHYGQQRPPESDDGSVPAETADRQKKKEHGESNLHAEEDFVQRLESLNLDPRLKKLLITYEEVFGALPPPLSCKKQLQMDLKLKSEFQKTRVRRRPYTAPAEQVEEIERQIQECIDTGLVEEYKKEDYPHHCSPYFLVAKPGSTALRLVVDYGEVNKNTQNHSGSIPNMDNTLEHSLSPRKLHPLLEEKDLKNDCPKNFFFPTFAAHMTQIPPKKCNFTEFAAFFHFLFIEINYYFV